MQQVVGQQLLVDEVAKAAFRHREARAREREAYGYLIEAVLQATWAGATRRRVAEAAGVTAARIQQMINEADRAPEKEEAPEGGSSP